MRPDQIGDRGQRYEVRARDREMPARQYQAAGWSDDLAIAERMRATLAWISSIEVVWIVDRQWVEPGEQHGTAPATQPNA